MYLFLRVSPTRAVPSILRPYYYYYYFYTRRNGKRDRTDTKKSSSAKCSGACGLCVVGPMCSNIDCGSHEALRFRATRRGPIGHRLLPTRLLASYHPTASASPQRPPLESASVLRLGRLTIKVLLRLVLKLVLHFLLAVILPTRV